jgi:hypothetical protein
MRWTSSPTVDPELAEIIDLKFFCGFSFGDIAAMRGVSERTVQRHWEKGRLYLHHATRRRASSAERARMSWCITPDRWRALSPLLDEALDLPAGRATPGSPRSAPATRPRGGAAQPARRARRDRQGLPREPVRGSAVPDGALEGQCARRVHAGVATRAGGMGSVWLAERSDGRFTGRVAVKLLNVALIGREGEERFKREGSPCSHASRIPRRAPHRRRRLRNRSAVSRDRVRRGRAHRLVLRDARARPRRRGCGCFSTWPTPWRMRTPT